MVLNFVLDFLTRENMSMKIIRLLGFIAFLFPCVSFAVSPDFQNASQLLAAARRGDTQTVQILINRGADINYIDSTGLSLVCTAVMNNDKRAIQVLQMYGADASNCDKQIKNYKQKSRVAARGEEYGFFSGLSSSHVLLLSAVGVAAVVGGVALLTNAFDAENNNGSAGAGGSHSGGGGGGGGGSTDTTTPLFTPNLPYGPACSGTSCSTDFTVWEKDSDGNPNLDFVYMSDTTEQDTFNYLMVARAYNAFVRGYLGMETIRISSDLSPFDLSNFGYYPKGNIPGGGAPINVSMITATGVNRTENTSAVDGFIYWVDESKITGVQNACKLDPTSKDCIDASIAATNSSHKYYNLSGDFGADPDENPAFDLTGGGTVFGSASDEDTKLAKIIAGWEYGERSDGDFYGFLPNGQLTVYKIGTGESGVSDYKNYAAMYQALTLSGANLSVVANLALPSESGNLSYTNVNDANVWINEWVKEHGDTTNSRQNGYAFLIDSYYNLDTTNDDEAFGKTSSNASDVYNLLAAKGDIKNGQILVNPAGHSLLGLSGGASLSPQVATFENYAPVVYPNLQNLFMTVVAVKPANSTKNKTISEYNESGSGKFGLSVWDNTNDSSVTYTSRMCGLTGTGNGGAMNPWCFAAPGTTDMEAAAAMAGSVGLVKSAFNYMTPNQIFLLLALTADGPYLGINPNSSTGYAKWTAADKSDLIEYLRGLYELPGNLESSDDQYLQSFKMAFGYGMINLERATRPGTNVYFYSADKKTIVSSDGKTAFWGMLATSSATNPRASTVLNGNGIITTSFFDVIESADGSISLPRVWNMELSLNNDYKHGLYMGDVLGEFAVDSTNKHSNKIGNMTFDMAMSPRAYNDNMNGLDNLKISFNSENYDLNAEYQRYLTDGESRFDGRANGLLSLVSNGVSSGAKYKSGDFAFGAHAFSGTITDENLLENDPVVTSQFEPGHLGFANGGAIDIAYNKDKFNLNVSLGNMNETNTVLGSISDGLLSLNGAKTQYVDVVADYKLFDKAKLSARATFANTRANIGNGIISEMSDIKSNAFAIGADVYGFSFTAAMPLAVVDGKMGYDYADLSVVENNGKYEVAVNNPHTEYIDLAAQKRELRFSGSYKRPLGEFTDAGIGFIYRVNPGNTDVFGNESILMFKLHHRLGIQYLTFDCFCL